MKGLNRQDIIAIGQLVIALLMLWSLRQTGKNLDYTKSQIEAQKVPTIDIASFENYQLHLLNSGGAEVEQFQVIGYLSVYYNEKTEEVTRVSISAGSLEGPILHDRLGPRGEFVVSFDKLTLAALKGPREKGEEEAFAAVFRYYRAADRKPFYKIVSFLRRQIEAKDPTPDYIYFPLYVAPGSAMSGPNKPIFKVLRTTLRELCVDNFGINLANEVP